MWYDDIENEVIARENRMETEIAKRIKWKDHRTTLEPIEYDILKAEKKALSHMRWCKYATRKKDIRHVYFTETGLRVDVEETIYVQNPTWINHFIQRELGSSGLILSSEYIRNLLEWQIKNVYIAADTKDELVTVRASKRLRKRLRKAS